MKVSVGVDINNNTVKYSSCGKYIAYGVENYLKIAFAQSIEIVSTFRCSHKIKGIEWASDSDHILCIFYKSNRVEAFSLTEPEWICSIDEGKRGLVAAVWSPKSYHILTVSQFHVRISVWSLRSRSVAFIDNPILQNGTDWAFSCDGNYFAVIVGTFEKYKILIFSTSSWVLKQEIPCTCNICIPSNVSWSPSNLHLAVWETVDLKTIFVEIYSLEKSKIVGLFRKTKTHKLCSISHVAWTPTGQFLLIGCHNENIYVLNYITWGVLTVFQHSQVIHDNSCQMYEESIDASLKNIHLRPVTLSKRKPTISAPPGIIRITTDAKGQYIASQCRSMPAVIWIWKVNKTELDSVLVLKNAVSDFKWSCNQSDLLICSGSRSLVIWRQHNPAKLDITTYIKCDLLIKSCLWCPRPSDLFNHFLIFSINQMHVVYNF